MPDPFHMPIHPQFLDDLRDVDIPTAVDDAGHIIRIGCARPHNACIMRVQALLELHPSEVEHAIRNAGVDRERLAAYFLL